VGKLEKAHAKENHRRKRTTLNALLAGTPSYPNNCGEMVGGKGTRFGTRMKVKKQEVQNKQVGPRGPASEKKKTTQGKKVKKNPQLNWVPAKM